MKSLEDKYLKKLKYSAKTLSDLRGIGEYKGKEELFSKQSPDALEKMLESAIVQSAESSSRIEGITAPHKRVKLIVEAGAVPRNRSEQEIAGYRDVLNLIHQSHKDIPLSENVILQFHSMLFRYTTKRSGEWKKINNEIVDVQVDGSKVLRFKPIQAHETSDYMKNLISLYNHDADKQVIDPLILIPLFVFDFLCVHPFGDGNGRVARLLTLLLLYKAGYKVGKYISLERIIEDSKESYYDALIASSKGWHEGKHDVFPWLEYFYGVMIAAYKEFESRVGKFQGKGSKTEQVKAAIERFIKPFSIIDIEKVCPNVSRDMIRTILRQLRNAGVIKSTSMGRGAMWVKVGMSRR
jgi:Fic family protein